MTPFLPIHRLLLATIVAVLAATTSTHARTLAIGAVDPARPVGWHRTDQFVAGAGGTDFPGLYRELYRPGEDAKSWHERIVVWKPDVVGARTAESTLDEYFLVLAGRCRDFAALPAPDAAEEAKNVATRFWLCRRNEFGRGEAGVARAVVADGTPYLMIAQGDYEPFGEDVLPITREQTARWSAVLRSFNACTTWTSPGCLPDAARLFGDDALPLTTEEATQVRDAETRGLALYRHDQIAWHGTDYAVANQLITRGVKGGYVAVGGEHRAGSLYFVRDGASRGKGVTRIDLDDFGHPVGHDLLKRLPDDVKPRYAALKAIRGVDVARCGETLNAIVVPADHGEWWVYVLSATTRPDVILLGGHTRARVSRNGRKLLAVEPLSRGCLPVSVAPRTGEADGDAAAAHTRRSVVTHLLSGTPIDTHVFQSLTHRATLVVVTAHEAWKVDAGRITKIAER